MVLLFDDRARQVERDTGRVFVGCPWCKGAFACGEAADSIRQELTARRAAVEACDTQAFRTCKIRR